MDDFPIPDSSLDSPHHGDRGARHPLTSETMPTGLTIALSREAGARGGTIGRRVARKLGWQVYDQELLEYVAHEGPLRQELVDQLTPAAAAWVEARMELLLREQIVSPHPSVVQIVRTILALGSHGKVVLIGRGAGSVLPQKSTLHIRIVAPLEDRIAYMSQWLRLTVEEATERVRLRDARRAEFLATYFHRQPTDVYQYDMLLNSSLLGEDRCADLIVQAARDKAGGG